MKLIVDEMPVDPRFCLFSKINWTTGYLSCFLGEDCPGVKNCKYLKSIKETDGVKGEVMTNQMMPDEALEVIKNLHWVLTWESTENCWLYLIAHKEEIRRALDILIACLEERK